MTKKFQQRAIPAIHLALIDGAYYWVCPELCIASPWHPETRPCYHCPKTGGPYPDEAAARADKRHAYPLVVRPQI